MRMALWTVARVLAVCLAAGAMAACDSDAGSDSPPGTPRSVEPSSGQGKGSSQRLDEQAAAADEAAQAIDSPPLLRIRNQTSQVVVLTSADRRITNVVAPGKSVQLMSKRVCRWIPLTASTEDGRLIDEYAEPCRGQTWTITDN